MQRVQADYAQRLKPLEEQLRKKQVELETYVASGNATTRGIKQRRAEVRKLTGRIEDLRLDAEGAVRKIAPDRGTFTYRGTGSRHWHGSYGCDWNACDWDRHSPAGKATPGASVRTWSSHGGCCR